MKSAVVSVLALASLLSGNFSFAQESSECDGVISILRISNYVKTGTEEGLREASFKHDEWYKSHGVTENKQVVIPILEYNRETDTFIKDRNRVSTLHLNAQVSANAREHQGDSKWNEFISLYNDNTEVMESVFVCLPESLFLSQ